VTDGDRAHGPPYLELRLYTAMDTTLAPAYLVSERFVVDWDVMAVTRTRQIGPLTRRYCVGAHDWAGDAAAEELSFKTGELVEVMHRELKGNPEWWVGRTRDGVVGSFPRNYVCDETAVQHVARAKLSAAAAAAAEPVRRGSLMKID